MRIFFISLLTLSLIWSVFYFFAVDEEIENTVSKDCYAQIKIINKSKPVITVSDSNFGWDKEKFLEGTKEKIWKELCSAFVSSKIIEKKISVEIQNLIVEQLINGFSTKLVAQYQIQNIEGKLKTYQITGEGYSSNKLYDPKENFTASWNRAVQNNISNFLSQKDR